MDMTSRIFEAHQALATARSGVAERLAETLREQRVVTLLGEAEVGKSVMIRQALGLTGAGSFVVALDLDEVASEEHVGHLLARETARAFLGESVYLLLRERGLVPREVERMRLELVELLGVEGLEEALRAWPSGRYAAMRALGTLELLARDRDVVLWLDHVETPRLTPRHPLDVDRLLWGIRALVQREEGLRVVVSANAGMADMLGGPDAAFHQQGAWVTLDVPSPGQWAEVATVLGAPATIAAELVEPTNGHPGTMLLGLLHVAESRRDRLGPEAVLRELATRDDGLAARAMQHARTLHRLGGQVLEQIAYGERPYAVAQRGSASPQEIRKVLNRLRLAGLLRRRGNGWAVVNPLVAIRLRGQVEGPSTIDDQ
jgi:hypothetical protein